MADDQIDGLDGVGVPPGWAPDGLMAGVPALNAAAGQGTLGAVMSPEQMADVDWGADGQPDLGPLGGHTLQLRGDEPVPVPVPLGSTNGQNARNDVPPWTVSGQDPGLVPPGSAPAGTPTADQIDPSAPVAVTPDPGLNGHGYRPAPGDDKLLARILMAESADTPDAMADVGWAITNRVGNPDFRPTLAGVINQPGQFQPVANGGSNYWNRTDPANDPDHGFVEGTPDAQSWAHAKDVAQGILNGTAPDQTNGATYFFSSPKYDPADATTAPSKSFQKMLDAGSLSPVSSYENDLGNNTTYIFRKVGH